MYKVSFFKTNFENLVSFQWFKTLEEVIEFAKTLPDKSVLEIKLYENSNNN